MFHDISVSYNQLLYSTVSILISQLKMIFPPIAIIHSQNLIHLERRAALQKATRYAHSIADSLVLSGCNLKQSVKTHRYFNSLRPNFAIWNNSAVRAFYPLKGSEVGAELHLTSPLVSYGEVTAQLGRIKFTLRFFQDHYLNSLRPNFGVWNGPNTKFLELQ